MSKNEDQVDPGATEPVKGAEELYSPALRVRAVRVDALVAALATPTTEEDEG